MQIPPSYSVGENVNRCSHCGKQYGGLSEKLKIDAPYDPAIPLLGILLLLFSLSVVPNSVRPQGLQHARLPCPAPSPRACSNSCPLSQCCHSTISSSVIPFSSCFQCFPASGSLQMSQLFTSGWPKYWGFSFNISPSNDYLGLISFRMDWLDLLAV